MLLNLKKIKVLCFDSLLKQSKAKLRNTYSLFDDRDIECAANGAVK